MNEVWIGIITLVMGGGLWAGVSAFIKSFAENKKTKAESADIGAKTPVEVDSISVLTMKTALDSANLTIDRQAEELAAIRTRLDNLEKMVRDQGERYIFLQRALASAQDYIGVLLAFIHGLNPKVTPPEPNAPFSFPPGDNNAE